MLALPGGTSMRTSSRFFAGRFVCLLAVTAMALSVKAQVNPYKNGTPGITGYRSEIMAEVTIQEDKFARLAEAIPAEKYTWRPSPEVRSFAEVFMHVSAANFNLYKLVGTPPPTGFDVKGFEKSTTDKAKVIATLKEILRPRQKSNHRNERRRPGKKPGLVRRKKHATWNPVVYRAPRIRASGTIHRLCPFCGHHSSMDRGYAEEAA